MSKREIYEKLMNTKLEGDVKEGDLGEMRVLIREQLQKIRDTVKGCNN